MKITLGRMPSNQKSSRRVFCLKNKRHRVGGRQTHFSEAPDLAGLNFPGAYLTKISLYWMHYHIRTTMAYDFVPCAPLIESWIEFDFTRWRPGYYREF